MQQRNRHCIYALCGILAALGPAHRNAQAATLKPGDDLHAQVAAAPPGTKFLLMPGTYVSQQIDPKDGDSFTGNGLVVLDGAKPLNFLANGRTWSASIGSVPVGKARCVADHPLCNIQRDLYLDDKPLVPVDNPNALTAGTWFYDQANGLAVIGINPAGHKLEIATAKWAFSNTAKNVTIAHLVVEKYASPPQFGAIGAQGALSNGQNGAQGWTVTDTEVRLSHGTGIQLSDNATVERCKVHHNGQKGVGARGMNVLIQENEIAFNNYAGYDFGWEAGGTKFSRTTNLHVLNNYVHDNVGGGLWADIDNTNATIRSNRVDHNAGTGIQYEISYAATIDHNTVRWNGSPPRVSLWQAQISVQNSSNVNVTDNVVIVPPNAGNGIVVINQERGIGDLGPRLGINNKVMKNTITYEGPGGASGLMDPLSTATNDLFDNNTYILKAGGEHFESRGKKTWEQFRALGNDKNSQRLNAPGGASPQ